MKTDGAWEVVSLAELEKQEAKRLSKPIEFKVKTGFCRHVKFNKKQRVIRFYNKAGWCFYVIDTEGKGFKAKNWFYHLAKKNWVWESGVFARKLFNLLRDAERYENK